MLSRAPLASPPRYVTHRHTQTMLFRASWPRHSLSHIGTYTQTMLSRAPLASPPLCVTHRHTHSTLSRALLASPPRSVSHRDTHTPTMLSRAPLASPLTVVTHGHPPGAHSRAPPGRCSPSPPSLSSLTHTGNPDAQKVTRDPAETPELCGAPSDAEQQQKQQ